ncbi:hypothetical protein [Nostoc sp.]|uniref:hypothetical protein n=1 Tax=Nostoc sp. TaxID=1180 RepID=UPI002FFCBFE0
MEPVDFAEVLAQIDVETERLGWTMEQRREHLIKNYGKRSLTLLTEVELLEFLQYLASQPTRALDEIFIKTSSKQSRNLLPPRRTTRIPQLLRISTSSRIPHGY